MKVNTEATGIFKNICQMPEKEHRLRQLADALRLSVIQLEKEIDVNPTRLGKAIARDSKISMDIVYKILEKYPQVSKTWLETGEGPMFISVRNEPFREAFDIGAWNPDDPTEVHRGKEYIDLGNGKYMLKVPLVTHIATMGYLQGYSDPEWLQELPMHVITVDAIPRGVYRTFIARGESMRDGTERSILTNSKVTGRVINQELYRHSKLHLHKYQVYIIVHKKGIMIKEITNHDVENGIITAHSWNPDKKQFPDQELHLSDVLQLLNVIKVERDF